MQKIFELFKKIGLGQKYIDKYSGLYDILDTTEEKEAFINEKCDQIEQGLKIYSPAEIKEVMEAQIDRLDGMFNVDVEKHAKAMAVLEKFTDKTIAQLEKL